jgi:hypothetical protein
MDDGLPVDAREMLPDEVGELVVAQVRGGREETA